MATLSPCERQLTFFVVVTLIVDILMALCVSLIMTEPKTSEKDNFVVYDSFNLYQIAAACNCVAVSLSYVFPYRPEIRPQPKLGNEGTVNKSAKQATTIKAEPTRDTPKPFPMETTLEHTLLTMTDRPPFTTTQNVFTTAAHKRAADVGDTESDRRKRESPLTAECFFPPPIFPEYIESATESNTTPTVDSFANLVSITKPKFLDDVDSRVYVCSGVLISSEHALTGSDCIVPALLFSYQVRSGSKYWSKEGNVHKIEATAKLNGLVLLTIEPAAVAFSKLVKTMASGGSRVWSDAASAGWNQDGRRLKRKYGSYEIKHWTRDQADFEASVNCSEVMGDPLITSEQLLVGIRTCNNGFVDTLSDEVQKVFRDTFMVEI